MKTKHKKIIEKQAELIGAQKELVKHLDALRKVECDLSGMDFSPDDTDEYQKIQDEIDLVYYKTEECRKEIKMLTDELAALQAEPEEEMYPKEFVEWLTGNDHWPVRWVSNCVWRINQYPLIESWKDRTLREIFDYWETLKTR